MKSIRTKPNAITNLSSPFTMIRPCFVLHFIDIAKFPNDPSAEFETRFDHPSITGGEFQYLPPLLDTTKYKLVCWYDSISFAGPDEPLLIYTSMFGTVDIYCMCAVVNDNGNGNGSSVSVWSFMPGLQRNSFIKLKDLNTTTSAQQFDASDSKMVFISSRLGANAGGIVEVDTFNCYKFNDWWLASIGGLTANGVDLTADCGTSGMAVCRYNLTGSATTPGRVIQGPIWPQQVLISQGDPATRLGQTIGDFVRNAKKSVSGMRTNR